MRRKILLVEDEELVRDTLELHFRSGGYEVLATASAEEAIARIPSFAPDVILTDVHMGGMSGLELLRRVEASASGIDVIVMTGHEDMATTISAIRDGAYDFLVKPLHLGRLTQVVQRSFRDRATRLQPQCRTAVGVADGGPAVGRSPLMIELYKQIGRVAGSRTPVLIRGETGTGKEIVARAIHGYSPAAGQPFITVNCTALTESLLESELFGHVKGAFTGAASDRKGLLEAAGSGTIFLDEIGDSTIAFQAKLLRVLQEREYYPVGGDQPRRTEARVLAATHRRIEELVREGKFREDLYFRLRVVEIVVPPLRERPGDIPLLAEHLLAKAARELGKDVRSIPVEVMRRLCEHEWPGNVREMENAITRAVVLAHGASIRWEDLGLEVHSLQEAGYGAATLEEVEHDHVHRILARTGGNKSRAAAILGISRPRLERILTRSEVAATS
jgi:DNA-binding NtrC family response regulator